MNLLQLGIYGALAYVLYESGLLSFLGISPAASQPSGSVQNPSAPSPSNPATPAPLVDTRGLVLQAVLNQINTDPTAKYSGSKSNPLVSADVWNYFYNQVRGRSVSGVNFPAGNISIDEFWGPASAAGFSGFAPASSKAPLPRNRAIPEPVNCKVGVPGMGRWIW